MTSPRNHVVGLGAHLIRFSVTVGLVALCVAVLPLEIPSVEAIPGPVPGPYQVALTFDDGPAPATGPILDILAQRGVPATFFVVGAAVDNARLRPLVERMHLEGHSVQNHSYRHPFLSRLSAEAVRNEIAATNRAVQSATGVATSCFRPPYGATNDRVRANALGHTEIMWTADSRDFLQPGVGSIVANSLRGADGRGMVVLLHDGGGSRHQTVAALPIIIDAYAARGYEFVNLCRPDSRAPAEPSEDAPSAVTAAGDPVGLEMVTPVRILDTRSTGDRVGAGSTTRISLPDTVRADATAVVAQITAVDPLAAGWLTSHRCDTGPPGTSSLNVDPSVTARAGTTIAPVVDGQVCIHSSTETHLLVDVTAVFVPGDGRGMTPELPVRVFDSRTGGSVLASGTVTRIVLAGSSAALVNVTATDSVEPGYVTAWPCDQPRPATSILNHFPGTAAVATSTIVPLGADGGLCLVNSGATSLIVDLGATVGADDELDHTWRFQRAEPVRLLDTRSGAGGTKGFLFPGSQIGVATDLPPGATALVTVTSTGSDRSGHLVMWRGTDPVPPTSALNYDRLDVANLATVTVDEAGQFVVRADGLGSTHVIVDLHGWFQPA